MSGRIIYWDSCAFIAWMCKNNKRTANEMAGLDAVATDFEKGNCQIISSVIYKLEVLAKNDEVKKLDLFTKRQNFTPVQVTEPIIEFASDLRRSLSVSTADAIHLATAIKYKAVAFHTFDGATGSVNKRLLALNGRVELQGLQIVAPCLDQAGLGI